MPNELRDFTIKLRCNEAFYRALVLMLRYAQKLGQWGSSRTIAIYCDGDGSDRIRNIDFSEPVPESNMGIISEGEAREIERVWATGDFWIDTDDVFSGVD